MDPNNTQQPNAQQPGFQESMAKPVQPAMPESNVSVVAPPAVSPEPMDHKPKSVSKKTILILLLLLIFAVGMGGYVYFAKNQLKSAQKISTENSTSTAIPTETTAPTITPATVEELNVESPDADLKIIEGDLQGL